MVKIAYLAHDLTDASVRRRAAMLRQEGAEVHLAGFRRRDGQKETGFPQSIELGPTHDGRLVARTLAVASAAARIAQTAPAVKGADAVLARNLEMLVLASRARRHFAPTARLIYECLDIHRLLLSKAMAGIALRALENRLWRETDAILTSSPAFIREYFHPRGFRGAILLTENKVMRAGVERAPASNKRPGPPWRIGYFGMLRCRRSLEILSRTAAAFRGKVKIEIRGVPSPAIFPNFEREIGSMPHVSYYGSYQGVEALAPAYENVHFAWAIDHYEDGQNSSWLLPNRLYESLYFGAIPIALASVETGRWLKRHAAGLCLGDRVEEELQAFLAALTPGQYDQLCREADAIDTAEIAFGEGDKLAGWLLECKSRTALELGGAMINLRSRPV